MTTAICSCLSDAGPWADRDEPGIPPSYTQTLRDGCAVHGGFRNRILVGDVREQLATLPDESVYMVVTSPPLNADLVEFP